MHLRVKKGDGFSYVPAEFIVWRRHVRECRAQVGASAAMGGADLNSPGKVSGICLRGLAGWGDNTVALDTVVNTFGGE